MNSQTVDRVGVAIAMIVLAIIYALLARYVILGLAFGAYGDFYYLAIFGIGLTVTSGLVFIPLSVILLLKNRLGWAIGWAFIAAISPILIFLLVIGLDSPRLKIPQFQRDVASSQTVMRTFSPNRTPANVIVATLTPDVDSGVQTATNTPQPKSPPATLLLVCDECAEEGMYISLWNKLPKESNRAENSVSGALPHNTPVRVPRTYQEEESYYKVSGEDQNGKYQSGWVSEKHVQEEE